MPLIPSEALAEHAVDSPGAVPCARVSVHNLVYLPHLTCVCLAYAASSMLESLLEVPAAVDAQYRRQHIHAGHPMHWSRSMSSKQANTSSDHTPAHDWAKSGQSYSMPSELTTGVYPKSEPAGEQIHRTKLDAVLHDRLRLAVLAASGSR
jgi:hypothetical protein